MKKLKKEEMFPISSYKNIGIDQLVIYSVKRILDNSEECTFERLVFECFKIFPAKFGLLMYPNWPDSTRINKAWLHCRTDKGWLAGTVKEGFRLTQEGEEIAKKTGMELNSKRTRKKILSSSRLRDRYESIINYIKTSSEYQKYRKMKDYDFNDSELKSFLGGTLETPKRILRHNLNLYLNAAAQCREESVIPFLEMCKNKLEKLRG